MESISDTALRKYEAIINEINLEYEKSQQLNESLNQENDKIVVSKLFKSQMLDKLSHIEVKIFKSFCDLCSLYGEDLDRTDLKELNEDYCNFYLVEIYISKCLLEKLCVKDWLVNITISCENINLSKTRKLPKNSSSFSVVFSLADNVIDCMVEAYLLNIKNNSIIVKLDEVNVDVSYHFTKSKDTNKSESKSVKIIQINNLYNKNEELMLLKSLKPLSYEIHILLDKHKFIELFLNNSCQNLDLELFTDLHSDNSNDFKLQIGIGCDKIVVIFNKKDIVKTQARYDILYKLKKYFFKVLSQEGASCDKINGLLEIKHSVIMTNDDAFKVYEKLRKISSSLPI